MKKGLLLHFSCLTILRQYGIIFTVEGLFGMSRVNCTTLVKRAVYSFFSNSSVVTFNTVASCNIFSTGGLERLVSHIHKVLRGMPILSANICCVRLFFLRNCRKSKHITSSFCLYYKHIISFQISFVNYLNNNFVKMFDFF